MASRATKHKHPGSLRFPGAQVSVCLLLGFLVSEFETQLNDAASPVKEGFV